MHTKIQEVRRPNLRFVVFPDERHMSVWTTMRRDEICGNCQIDDGQNDLIRAVLIHYQFETIHPFWDRNGRVGRLLILLYLMERKVLTAPILCTSCFFCRNRTEYYERMTEVRRKGNHTKPA